MNKELLDSLLNLIYQMSSWYEGDNIEDVEVLENILISLLELQPFPIVSTRASIQRETLRLAEKLNHQPLRIYTRSLLTDFWGKYKEDENIENMDDESL